MGYVVLTLMVPLLLLTTMAPEYVIPLIVWNLGFWVRFAIAGLTWSRVKELLFLQVFRLTVYRPNWGVLC